MVWHIFTHIYTHIYTYTHIQHIYTGIAYRSIVYDNVYLYISANHTDISVYACIYVC